MVKFKTRLRKPSVWSSKTRSSKPSVWSSKTRSSKPSIWSSKTRSSKTRSSKTRSLKPKKQTRTRTNTIPYGADVKVRRCADIRRKVSYVTSSTQSPYVERDGHEVHKTIYETRMICDEDIVGSFTIESNFDNSLLTMSISIDDDFQGKGHARGMIREMCAHIRELNIIDDDQLLYIDTDASDEFWVHIGMNKNANFESEDSTIIGSGYEYEIEFGALEYWANKK